MKKYILFVPAFFFLATVCFTGCQKEYYKDTGLTNPKFSGNMMDYFAAHPRQFDTLAQVIKIAGMEKYFTDSTITFFAPADESIEKTFKYINEKLKSSGRDTLTSLQSIKPEFWARTLKMYIFRGVKRLQDFPQLDYRNRQSFSGEFLSPVSDQTMNVGTVFTDANGLKYKGYRFLTLNYVPSNSSPYQGWISAYVASSNINPTNGIIHALMYVDFRDSGSSYYSIDAHSFGFNLDQAWAWANYIGFN